jgi:hypothetical protein
MTKGFQRAAALGLALLVNYAGLAAAKPRRLHVPAALSWKARPVQRLGGRSMDPPLPLAQPSPVRASGSYGTVLEGRNPAAGALP